MNTHNTFYYTFNLCIRLFIAMLFAAFIQESLLSLVNTLRMAPFLDLQHLAHHLLAISAACSLLSTIPSLIITYLIAKEVSWRLRHDKITNMFESIYYSLKLRNFLRLENTSKTDTWLFNQAVKQSTVTVFKDKVSISIPIPKQQEARKLFKDAEIQMREEVATYFPKYSFSTPVRQKNRLIITGGAIPTVTI